MIKKVAIIGTVGLPANYGGFETLSEHLTKQLGIRFDMKVFCSSVSYREKLKTHNNAELIYLPLKANGVQSIAYDILSIIYALFIVDTLLILGVSGCIILPFVKFFTKKRIIVNIDGLEWKRAKWGTVTKWFLKYSEKLAVKHADIVIADNKVIQQYVRHEYAKKASLISYGADHTSKETLKAEVLNQFPFLEKKYAFKVCRIEPENNVHIILDAFSQQTSLSIVIVGNWKNSKYGEQLKIEFDSYDNIYLLDPIYDQHILNQIRSNCYLYVHGHSAGGTNPSLVEAMHLELPVLAYSVPYNLETTRHKALYFADAKTLTSLLISVQEQDLEKTSKALKELADEFYSWEVVITQYAALL
jgi:glycosyltransferase involved in cell wall biosynthesis